MSRRPIGLLMGALATAVFFGAVGGCARQAGALSPRESLRQALLAHHQSELESDPGAVAEKFRRMARTNFGFFRGSLGLHPADPSRFAEAAPVAVFGDPHPENVGTFALTADETIVDFNDFDRAGFGSFIEDLRRLCLGLFIAGDAADVPKKHRVRLVEAAVNGYLSELRSLARDEPPVALRGSTAFGGGLAQILGDPAVAHDGASEATAPAGGNALDEPERKALTAALVVARSTLWDAARLSADFFTVKRAVRTRGGIASLFVERLRVDVEGPSPAADDDVLLELKATPAAGASNLVKLQRQLQERPDEDPLLGVAELAGKIYRSRSLGPAHRSVSVERLSDEVKGPGWGKKDFRVFAFETGRLLARGHARAKGPTGQPGLATLLEAAGDGRTLKNETVEVTGRAANRLEANVDDLRRLLAEQGPLLGWKPATRP